MLSGFLQREAEPTTISNLWPANQSCAINMARNSTFRLKIKLQERYRTDRYSSLWMEQKKPKRRANKNKTKADVVLAKGSVKPLPLPQYITWNVTREENVSGKASCVSTDQLQKVEPNELHTECFSSVFTPLFFICGKVMI